MKILKWILFIPVAFLGYYIFIIILGFANNILTAPPPNDNPLLNNYILPIIINAIGIFSYFFIGNKIIQSTNEVDNLAERKISNILLFIIILTVSICFAYLSFKEDEYYKGIVNSVNVFASIIAFLINFSKPNK